MPELEPKQRQPWVLIALVTFCIAAYAVLQLALWLAPDSLPDWLTRDTLW